MTAALVPVKDLSGGKSRLAPHLSRPRLERLSLAMLEDLLAALRAVPEVERVAVVTPDPRVAEAARAAGAEAILDEDGGLNPSLEAGARALGLAPDAALLVVLGDLPTARAEDVRALFGALAELGGRGVVIAAADDGGTAALLRAPAGVIAPRFGPGSARAHRTAAESAGCPVRTLRLPSLAVDVDDLDDLRHLLRGADDSAPRTRRALAGLEIPA